MNQRYRNPPTKGTVIFYDILRFILAALYKVLFGWYDILSRWRANASLLYDVKLSGQK